MKDDRRCYSLKKFLSLFRYNKNKLEFVCVTIKVTDPDKTLWYSYDPWFLLIGKLVGPKCSIVLQESSSAYPPSLRCVGDEQWQLFKSVWYLHIH